MSDTRGRLERKRIPTGWCTEGQHEICTDFYLKREYNRGCVCDCHKTKEETP